MNLFDLYICLPAELKTNTHTHIDSHYVGGMTVYTVQWLKCVRFLISEPDCFMLFKHATKKCENIELNVSCY